MKDEDTHKDLFLCLEVVLADATKAVADLEGVEWVPWNPPFEGLPSRILSKSVQT